MLAFLGTTEIMFLALLAVPLALAAMAFWIWTLLDCVRNRALSETERIVWVIVICLTHWLGALIYLLAGRRSGGNGQPVQTR